MMGGRGRAFRFPGRVYAIVDSGVRSSVAPVDLAETLLDAGVRLLQLRAKLLATRDFCDLARAIGAACRRRSALFIVNDRADIARLVEADGVHLGQTDLPPRDARRILGDDAVIGFSTHNLAQITAARDDDALDYLAFGPIFATASKADADPRQGIEGLRAARAVTARPLVAIGGIDGDSAADVLAAGADAVAMIGALAKARDPAELLRRIEGR